MPTESYSAGQNGAGGAAIVGTYLKIINSGTIAGGLGGDGITRANAITFSGLGNVLELQAGSTIIGNVVATDGAGTLMLGGGTNSSLDVSQIGPAAQYQGFDTFNKTGASTWTLTNTTTASTPWRIEGGTLSVSSDASLGAVAGTLTLAGGTLQTTASFASARAVTLDVVTGTFEPVSGTTLTLSGNIGGSGSLIKTGNGTLNLTGTNGYSGGTTVSNGILRGNSNSLQGNILNNALVVFQQDITGTYAGNMTGNGDLHVRGRGTLTMTGTNTFTGPTSVSGTNLIVNGSLASHVTLADGATLGGNAVVGHLTSRSSNLAPGNSIGTLRVAGTFAHSGGTYMLDVNGQGQSDLISIGGPAALNSVTVQIQPVPGSYANSTTYLIASAQGGMSGTYLGTTDNLAFLTPTLSSDANNAYLTLALQGAAFSAGGITANQQGAGSALDRSYSNAGGDLATVIGALAGLTNAQGPAALEAISGQAWADFGTMNLAGASMFMNGVMQQMALARGSVTAGGQRQALAQACDVTMCEASSPFSVWGSLMGGAGSVSGNGNASTATYLQGGTAAGIDYRLDSRFLVGLGVGYSSGSLWVNNFQGKGWNDTIMASLYASFAQGGFYLDALAGYGYASNQMQRQIVIPNLDPRLASGSAGANQFLGQAEFGYQVPVYAPAHASVTPFARLQAINVTQKAFSEWGANSLSLNVQQQATNALRSTLGAQLEGSVPLGNRSLDLSLRVGWQREFASTGRPITAAFAGAPSASFTVYGASAPRDAAVIALSAATRIADTASLFLRYEGALASAEDNHTISAGLRFSW